MKKNKLELTKEYIEQNPKKTISEIISGLMNLLDFNKGNATAYYKKATASSSPTQAIKSSKPVIVPEKIVPVRGKVKVKETVGIDAFFEEDEVINKVKVFTVDSRTDIFNPNSKDYRDSIRDKIVKYGKYGTSIEAANHFDKPEILLNSIKARKYIDDIIADDSFEVPAFLKRKIYKDEV